MQTGHAKRKSHFVSKKVTGLSIFYSAMRNTPQNFYLFFFFDFLIFLIFCFLNKCIFFNIKTETEEKQLLMKVNILSH